MHLNYSSRTIFAFLIFTLGPVLKLKAQAVPFLRITPDARTGAMGEAGAAVPPDVNSTTTNPAKLAFLEQQSAFSVTYIPWLKRLASDIHLGYVSGFYKLNDRSSIAGSLRYFSFGKIELVDENKQNTGVCTPNEFALDGTYAKRFGDSFALGTTLRYIRSNLSAAQPASLPQTWAADALAVDISAYLKKQTLFLGSDAILALGATISNIGTKMRYTETGSRDFLPSNLKIGGAATFLIDEFNQITIALDFNRLLVPVQLQSEEDERTDNTIKGKASADFREELKKINISSGAEYLYDQKFALRAGYFYGPTSQGGHRYFTTGIGLKYGALTFDFACLIADQQRNPLANTLRFTMVLSLNSGL